MNENMKSTIFVGDNTDQPNFGCRATSMALAENLKHAITFADRIYRKEVLQLFAATPICDDWPLYFSAVKKSLAYKDLISRISQTDAVILNGEGSFIFQTPPRLDLHNYLVILSACMEAGKPFYVLNFMFSAYAEEPINVELMEHALSILENAEAVCVRDLESKRIIESKNDKIIASYVPDALFAWYSVLNDNDKILKNMITHSRFALPFLDNCNFYNNLDFAQPYVLFSGNSYAAHHKNTTEKSFADLAAALKIKAEEFGFKLYLIECCGGDSVLRSVAQKIGIPLIPVTINIYLAAYILANAKCFISGRYHPSILASLGGTPCVLMKANSHKTLSLQAVLEIPCEEHEIFSAIPEQEEILRIVAAFEKAVKCENRRKLKAICEKNALLASNIISIFEED